jgi:Histone deacetylation protein Rxt3
MTRQDINQNPLRMLPPPSPPSQRHPQTYTGMDLPPLSSLTTGLPHRPPSSGGMSISGMLGVTTSTNDMGMHSHHHHHSPHHHHHRPPPRPYTPEYGNPLAPSSTSSSNPPAPRSQSTPTTPALGYPEAPPSSHGRSNSYDRLPTSNVLHAPFRDPSYRPYMNRDPLPHQRDEFPPRPRDIINIEPSISPPPQHPSDSQKSGNAPYAHQAKQSALNTGIPPPAVSHHQPQTHPQQRPVTNSSTPRGHQHHSRPPSQPLASRQQPLPPTRPPPKLHINNTPALEAVAHINPKPFLGRFIYEPGWIIPASVTEDNLGGRFEVRIAQRFLQRDNESVTRRKLWGTGVYTDDSDVVAGPYLLR